MAKTCKRSVHFSMISGKRQRLTRTETFFLLNTLHSHRFYIFIKTGCENQQFISFIRKNFKLQKFSPAPLLSIKTQSHLPMSRNNERHILYIKIFKKTHLCLNLQLKDRTIEENLPLFVSFIILKLLFSYLLFKSVIICLNKKDM